MMRTIFFAHKCKSFGVITVLCFILYLAVTLHPKYQSCSVRGTSNHEHEKKLQNLTAKIAELQLQQDVLISQHRQEDSENHLSHDTVFLSVKAKLDKNMMILFHKHLTCDGWPQVQARVQYSPDNNKDGKLIEPDGTNVDVSSLSIIETETGIYMSKNSPTFMSNLVVFFNLYQMQGWPGVPTLHGTCVMLKSGREIGLESFSLLEVKKVQYVIQRYAKAQPVCGPILQTSSFNDKCIALLGLINHLKFSSFSLIGSIKTMISISKIFETFLKNGLYPLNFHPKHLVFTDNYDIVMQFPDGFENFLFGDRLNTHYRKFLSGTTCTTWQHCPTVGLDNRGAFLYQLGKHCKELRGYCTPEMRCSGLDTHLHLCIFSRWIFQTLSDQVSDSWPHKFRLTELLACSRQATPQFRCSWTSFRRGLEIVLEFAQTNPHNQL
ncbi:uncharacterized protein LOC144747564 [Ciona intestinalis]